MMKKLFKLMVFVLMAIAVWGCSNEEPPVSITLSEQTLDFKQSGSSKNVEVTCAREWEATSSASWCTVRRDKNILKVTVSVNYSDKERSADVVISAENSNTTATIVVYQAAGSGEFSALAISSEDWDLNYTGSSSVSVAAIERTYTVDVNLNKSGLSWSVEAELDEGSKKFYEFTPISSHKGSGSFSFTTLDNSSYKQHKATFKIVCEVDGVKDEYLLHVSQRAAEVVAKFQPTTNSEYSASYDLAAEFFPSDADVEMVIGSEWVKSDGSTFGVTVEDNLTIEDRVGKVYFVSKPDGEKIDSVLIHQRAGLTIPILLDCNSYITDWDDPQGTVSRGCPSCAGEILTGSYTKQAEELDIWGGMKSTTCWRKEFDKQRAQLTIFFYTKCTGKLNTAIRGKMVGNGKAKMQVSCNGKSYEVNIQGGDLHDTPVGIFEVDKPQWVRIDIRGIESTTYFYPYISDLVFGGDAVNYATEKCDEVWFVTLQDAKNDNPHWIRRGPAVHQGWHLPKDSNGNDLTVEYFYNEVLVPKGNDVAAAYYMTTGGDGFYMGIQPGSPDKNNKNASVLFSVWHNESRRKRTRIERYSKDIPGKTFDGLRDTTYHVVLSTYDHEGSGTGTRLHYPWKTDEVMATLCQVRPEVDANGKRTGNSIYAGYFWTENTGWILMAEIRRPAMERYYTAPYSFNENFSPHDGYITRWVEFPRQYFITPSGEWHECLGFHQGGGRQVSAGLEGRNDCSSGVLENGHFYGRICGYYNNNEMPLDHVYRQPSNKPHPEIDFAALEQLGERIDWVNKTNIPAGFENWKEDY